MPMRSSRISGRSDHRACARDQVFEIPLPPRAVVEVLELETVAGATADVRRENRVALLREKLRERVPAVGPLRRRAAVGPHEK